MSKTIKHVQTKPKITYKTQILNKLKDLEDWEEIVYNVQELESSSGHGVNRKTKENK